jgi:hypothetical protein
LFLCFSELGHLKIDLCFLHKIAVLHACLRLQYQVLHRLLLLFKQMCLSRLHQVLWQLAPNHLIKARVVASFAHIELLHHDGKHILSFVI